MRRRILSWLRDVLKRAARYIFVVTNVSSRWTCNTSCLITDMDDKVPACMYCCDKPELGQHKSNKSIYISRSNRGAKLTPEVFVDA